MADYYEIRDRKDGSYTVTPRNNPGCLSVILVILFVMAILAVATRCDSDSANQSEDDSYGSGATSYSENIENIESAISNEVKLTDLHVFADHSDVLDNIRRGSVTDTRGKVYDGPYFVLTSYYYNGWQEAYTELVVGGEYTLLTGTIFADADYDDYEITFRIYADGIEIYDSGPITRSTGPIRLNVPIEGATIVRVAAIANDTVGITNAAHIILADAVVHKS